MKSLKIFMLAAVAVVAGLFTACSDEDFTAGPEASGAQVYFPESIASEFSIGDEVSEIVIPVMRIVADEAQTVPILSEEESGLFTIPESVAFAAGETKTELTLTFDRTALEDGVEYPVSLLINDEANTTPYGNRTLSFSVVPWPWELLGTGLFREDYLGPLFGAASPEIEVQIHKHKTREGIYMVEDMFGWNYLTEVFEATQAQLSKQWTITPTNIVIDCSDPDAVNIARQWTGITETTYGYGDFLIWSDEPGTLVNGVITFPASGMTCGMAGTQKAYYANTNGNFRVLLPGAEIVDYSLAVEYESMRVDSEGETSAVLTFTYGADVTAIDYVVAAGSLKADERATLAEAIAAGTAEHINKITKLDATGSLSDKIALTESGAYTLVAVAYDKAGKALASDFVSINFFFPGAGGGGSAPDCDIQAVLVLPSKLFKPETAANYPDESNLGYMLTGSELKSAKMGLFATAVVEGSGLDPETIVESYGSDMAESRIETINTSGMYANVFIKLDSDTSYTLIIKATNVYGKSKVVTAECSTAAEDFSDYEGELVIGNYSMSYQASETVTYENTFTLKPVKGSTTDFTVTNLGLNTGSEWYATYDSATHKLTVSGVEVGYEEDGNAFGSLYGYWNDARTQIFGFCSYASEESAGDDPCVFSVDPSTNQLSAIDVKFTVEVVKAEGYDFLGYGNYFPAGTAVTLVPATSAAAKVQRSGLAFSSVNLMNISKIHGRLKSNIAVSDSGLSLSLPVRTLDVKPVRCERPKTVGRVAGAIKLNENLRLAK